ncbi:hypothetical protein BCT41_24020 [Vibrio splendidus]|uniref:hypothetical protein n=2 Tax=Vibrio TaxID=662 RepID=UPI000C82C241|nr:hypothetical protein [Vibrio splendidus]PMN17819.1 hypothetical protein BCT41_24020 [Vibrio splendidus]
MDKILEYISKEWAVISQAPFAFLILGALMFALAYLAAKWKFTVLVDEVKAKNETLKERLLLKTEQAESYKDRALKYDENIQQVVGSDEIMLKDKTLEVVKNLRDFIERHKREDDRVSNLERSAMREANTEEDKNKAWERNTSEIMRLSNDRNAEYDRRFRVDAMLLRDELRSRLPNYEPSERHHDMMYEHPTNYFGFNDVASDLERMAKLLTSHSS